MTPSEIIMSRVTRGDMLAQLAEECCELAQAALKLRRTLEGTSPTPTTMDQAEANLMEEIADVLLTMKYVTEYEVAVIASPEIDGEMDYKEKRWARRLNNE